MYIVGCPKIYTLSNISGEDGSIYSLDSHDITSPYINSTYLTATNITNVSLTSRNIYLSDSLYLRGCDSPYSIPKDSSRINCSSNFFYSGCPDYISGLSNENIGSNLDMNDVGDFLVVSSTQANSNAGLLKTYHWDGGSWSQSGVGLNGSSAGDNFGHSISLNSQGDVLAVGANTSNSNAGSVNIYDWIGSQWTLRSSLVGQANENFGSSVSLNASGDYLAVGSASANESSGIARVYKWDDTNWELVGSDITGLLDNEHLGCSIDISDDGLVIAAGGSGANLGDGIVRSYEYRGSPSSGQIGGILFIADSDESAKNGISISLSQIEGGATPPDPAVPSTAVFDLALNSILISGDISNQSVTYLDLFNDLNAGSNLTEISNAGFNINLIEDQENILISEVSPILTEGGQDPLWNILGDTISGESNENFGAKTVIKSNSSAITSSGPGGNGGNGIIKQYNLVGSITDFEDSRSWFHYPQDIEGKSFDVNGGFDILSIGIDSYNSNSGICKVYGKVDGNWEQIGDDLLGQFSNEQFGHAVSLNQNGSILTSSANLFGSNQGVIRQYDFDHISRLNLESTKVTAENLNLDYYKLPTSDPLVKGDVWRDQQNFLKISPGWTPSTLNTIAWYDAADDFTITSSSNIISQLNDKSGNNVHLTVPAGRFGPKTGIRVLNELNVIEWDASLQLLENSLFSHNQSSIPLCIAIIFRADYDNNQDFLFAGTDSVAAGDRMALRRTSTGSIQILGGSGTGANIALSSDAGTVLEGQDYIVSAKLNSSSSTIRLNGSLVKSGNIGTNQLTSLSIGGNAIGTQNIKGYVAEFVAFLDTDEEEIVEGYLAHKWNLVSNLPLNHPYKTDWPF